MIAAKPLIGLILLTSGCIMIDTDLQLSDETVKPVLTGEDCVGIYFGIGTGTVRMTEAIKTPGGSALALGSSSSIAAIGGRRSTTTGWSSSPVRRA